MWCLFVQHCYKDDLNRRAPKVNKMRLRKFLFEKLNVGCLYTLILALKRHFLEPMSRVFEFHYRKILK